MAKLGITPSQKLLQNKTSFPLTRYHIKIIIQNPCKVIASELDYIPANIQQF